MQALGNDYSAFPHRDYFKNVIEIIGAYEDDSVGQEVNDFVRAWRDRFANTSGYDKFHVYQNYAHDDEPLSALYGYQDWRHERLTKILTVSLMGTTLCLLMLASGPKHETYY